MKLKVINEKNNQNKQKLKWKQKNKGKLIMLTKTIMLYQWYENNIDYNSI